jgi:hypothetical protein
MQWLGLWAWDIRTKKNPLEGRRHHQVAPGVAGRGSASRKASMAAIGDRSKSNP